MTEKLQLALTLLVTVTYCYLAATGKANIEGFVMLSTYVIKKFLDIIEVQPKGGAQ